MKYTATVVWSVIGYVEVEADTEEEARQKVQDAPLPARGDYVTDSFEIDDIQCHED